MSDELWYLARYAPGKSQLYRFLGCLEHKNICAWTPLIGSKKPRTDTPGYRHCIEPLFPGYIFIALDVDNVHPSSLDYTPGFSGFVRFGGSLQQVPDCVIDYLMSIPACQTGIPLPQQHFMQTCKKAQKKNQPMTPAQAEFLTRVKTIVEERSLSATERTSLFLAFMEGVDTGKDNRRKNRESTHVL